MSSKDGRASEEEKEASNGGEEETQDDIAESFKNQTDADNSIVHQAAIKIGALVRGYNGRNRARHRVFEVYEKIYDPRSRGYYYYNKIFDVSSWVKPKILGFWDFTHISGTYTKPEAAVMIQSQWRKYKATIKARIRGAQVISKIYDDSTGAFYYYNSATEIASWQKPGIFGSKDVEDYLGLELDETDGFGSETPSEADEEKDQVRLSEVGEEDSDDNSAKEQDSDSEVESVSDSEEETLAGPRPRKDGPRSQAQFRVDAVEQAYFKVDGAGEKLPDIIADQQDPEVQKSLDMTGLGAHRISSRIYEIRSLEKLVLKNNKLDRLSPDIADLKKLTCLDASHNRLKTIPDDLENLEKLSALILSHNKMYTFHANIYKISTLTIFDLSYNEFQKIPLEVGDMQLLKATMEWKVGIGLLKNLTFLNISHNRLVEYPEQLERCTLLEVLDLSHNKIEDVPGLIKAHEDAMKSLNLSHNLLEKLPYEISNLKVMESFNCSHNRLSEIRFLSHNAVIMPTLASLDISYNILDAVPDGLEVLSGLKELDISHNKINSVATCKMSNLTNLEKLEFSINRLGSLSTEFSHLVSLKDLSVSGNKLMMFPEVIRHLTELERLDLSSNQFDDLGNSTLQDVTKLTYLNLSRNSLRLLPNEIFNLHALTYLDVQGNRITELPTSISELSNLTELYLNHNSLPSVCPDISALVNVKRLHLHANLLSSLPMELTSLASLSQITLSHNKFEETPPVILKMVEMKSFNISDNLFPDYELQDRAAAALCEGPRRLHQGDYKEAIQAFRNLPEEYLPRDLPGTKGAPMRAVRATHKYHIGVAELQRAKACDARIEEIRKEAEPEEEEEEEEEEEDETTKGSKTSKMTKEDMKKQFAEAMMSSREDSSVKSKEDKTLKDEASEEAESDSESSEEETESEEEDSEDEESSGEEETESEEESLDEEELQRRRDIEIQALKREKEAALKAASEQFAVVEDMRNGLYQNGRSKTQMNRDKPSSSAARPSTGKAEPSAAKISSTADLFWNRGSTYYLQQNYHTAIPDMNRVAKQLPNYTPAVEVRARARQKIGQYTQAKNECNKILRLDPENKFAKALREEVKRELYYLMYAGVGKPELEQGFEVQPNGTCVRRRTELRNLYREGRSLQRGDLEYVRLRRRKRKDTIGDDKDRSLRQIVHAREKREKASIALQKSRKFLAEEQRREEEEQKRLEEEERARREAEQWQHDLEVAERELQSMQEEEQRQRQVEYELRRQEELASREHDEDEELLRLARGGRSRSRATRQGVSRQKASRQDQTRATTASRNSSQTTQDQQK